MASKGQRLPYRAWLRKVEKVIGEGGGEYAIVRFLGLDDDNKPQHEDVDASIFEDDSRPPPGTYHLIDADTGEVITECVITTAANGALARRAPPINPEAVVARSFSTLSESWGQHSISLKEERDAYKKEAEKLREEVYKLKEENLGLKNGGDEDDLTKLIPVALELLKGRKDKETELAFLNRYLPQLTPQAQAELIQLVKPGEDG